MAPVEGIEPPLTVLETVALPLYYTGINNNRINISMKDLLKVLPQYLPQILQTLPAVIKYVPILLIICGIGFGIYYFFTNYTDPYMCVDNEIYERISIDSKVYKFKGGYCVSGTNN